MSVTSFFGQAFFGDEFFFTGAPVTPDVTGGHMRERKRREAAAAREEAEILQILQEVIPVIERDRRGRIR